MKQVNIYRKSDNWIGWSATLEDSQVDSFVEIEEQNWGKPIRWVPAIQCSFQDIENALDSREIESAIEGEEPAIEYQLDAEYRIEILDIGNEPLWAEVRMRRNSLLSLCDWTVLSDAPLTANEKTAWLDYRQALRDIPNENEDPTQIVWPSEPS